MKKTRFLLTSALLSVCLLLISGTAGNAQMIQTFPHFEDFESFNTCGTVCGMGCTLPLTSFWFNDPFGDGLDWTVDENGTPSGNTGPSTDHNPGTSNGNYLYTEASSTCSNDSAFLITPFLDFSNLQAPTMDFWYHMFGGSMGTLHVDVSLDSGTTWVRDIITPITDNQNIWQQQIVKLNAYAGDTIVIRMRAITGNTFTSDMAIDDFRIYELPPVDLGVEEILRPISGCGLGLDSIQVRIHNYGGANFEPGDTVYGYYQIDSLPIVSHLFVLTDTIYACGGTLDLTFPIPGDFSQVGNYNVGAWTAQPGDGDNTNDSTSTLIRNFSIRTVFPYFDNMESGPADWSSDGVYNTWAFGTPIKNVIIGAASGINAWTTGGLGTGDYADDEHSWVENLNCFDFTNQTNLWVAASIWYNSEFSWDGTQLQYSTDGGLTWSTLGAVNDPHNWYNDNSILGLLNAGFGQEGWTGRQSSGNGSGGWITAKYDLGFLMGQPEVRFRFFMAADGSIHDDGFAFDNFVIAEPPPPPNLGPDVTLCDTIYQLDGNVGPGFYIWDHGPVGAALAVDTTGEYILTYTDTLGLCSKDTVQVTLLKTFYPDLGPDTLLCAGDVTQLDAGNDTNVVSYLWSTLATTQTISVNSGGTYSVSVTTTDGCVKADTINVSAVTTPTVDLGPDTLVCDVVLTLDAGIPGAQYSWNTLDTTQTITVSSSGTYSVSLTACGTTVSDTVVVTLNGVPNINLGNDTTGCGTLTLDAGTFSSYAWTPSGNTAQQETFTSSGIATCTVTDAAGCPNTDSILVTILPLPTPQVAPADTFFCSGDSMCISLTSVDSTNSYLWSTGSTDGSICVNIPGQYWVICTDSNGCQGNDSSTVTVLAEPVVSITVDTTLCPTIFFTGTNTGGMVSNWDWNFGDQSTGQGDTISHTYTSKDTFTVVLTASNACGLGTAMVDVPINCEIGIEDMFPNGAFALYPNPNQGAFTLDFTGITGGSVNWEILNLLGQSLLKSEPVVLRGDRSFPVDLTDLPAGTYLAKVTIGGIPLLRRVVIQ